MTALPGGAQFGPPLTATPASSPSGSMPPEDIPGLSGAGMPAMPTVPSPRQPAPPGSVTPLPTAEEPGWWTKPSAAQPVMSDTGPGGEGDAVAHGPAGNGNGAGGANGNGAGGYGADDSHVPPVTPPVTPADLGGYDLPVRVRQASLAPQLRDKSLPAGRRSRRRDRARVGRSSQEHHGRAAAGLGAGPVHDGTAPARARGRRERPRTEPTSKRSIAAGDGDRGG